MLDKVIAVSFIKLVTPKVDFCADEDCDQVCVDGENVLFVERPAKLYEILRL